MAKKKADVFPTQVFVKREHDGSETYLTLNEQVEDAMYEEIETRYVAIYRLHAVKQYRNRTEEVPE